MHLLLKKIILTLDMNRSKFLIICFCFFSSLAQGQKLPDSSVRFFKKTNSTYYPGYPVLVDSALTANSKAPQYPGGDSARIVFLQSNIKYPPKAIKKHIQGTVYVSFIVEKDGSLSNAKVIKEIGKGCDEEALRVVKLFPKWIPATRNGELVRVLVYLPINFYLPNNH